MDLTFFVCMHARTPPHNMHACAHTHTHTLPIHAHISTTYTTHPLPYPHSGPHMPARSTHSAPATHNKLAEVSLQQMTLQWLSLKKKDSRSCSSNGCHSNGKMLAESFTPDYYSQYSTADVDIKVPSAEKGQSCRNW